MTVMQWELPQDNTDAKGINIQCVSKADFV